ncbi:unnamed protein product [Adineta ricciae]|uniref:F-box domain-containing protein n=1 Tax=Adineta ricciae TaxID=249248 RepID=A0A815YR15_ADIRI|nr:unnamed protein product [Adineta ricciae]
MLSIIFIYIYFLTFLSSTVQHRCLGFCDVYLSFNETLNAIPSTCDKTFESGECFTELSFDYVSKLIHVKFGEQSVVSANATSDDYYLSHETEMWHETFNVQWTIFKHKCYNEDTCDLKYVNTKILEMRKLIWNFAEFQQKLYSALFTPDSTLDTIRCASTDGQPATCSDEIKSCSLNMDNLRFNNTQRGCSSRSDDHARKQLGIKEETAYFLDGKEDARQSLVEYVCNHDLCNERDPYHIVMKLLIEYNLLRPNTPIEPPFSMASLNQPWYCTTDNGKNLASQYKTVKFLHSNLIIYRRAMPFESLPDELLLIIFSHLHQIDVIRTFTNLNQRFQRMIIPFASVIDLTYRNIPSYRLYQSFCQDVLPWHGPNIRSLRLAGNQQLYFIQPQLHRLMNLQSLTLIGERSYDINKFVIEKQFLIDILTTSSCLSELIIFPAERNALHIIASHSSPNLSTLTLLFYNDIPNFTLTTSLIFIKRLYINLWSLKAVKQLLRILPSIEQLYLSLLRFKDSTNCHLIQVPPTLTKLHLEINGFCYSRYGPQFDYIYQFLNAFKDRIYSLDLIFINALREFSIYNRFQSLTKDFVRLQSFQYYLQTRYQPHFPHLFSNVEQLQNSTYILYTLPRLQPFDTVSNRTSVYHDMNYNPNQTFVHSYECPLISNHFDDGHLLTPTLDEQFKLVNVHQ